MYLCYLRRLFVFFLVASVAPFGKSFFSSQMSYCRSRSGAPYPSFRQCNGFKWKQMRIRLLVNGIARGLSGSCPSVFICTLSRMSLRRFLNIYIVLRDAYSVLSESNAIAFYCVAPLPWKNFSFEKNWRKEVEGRASNIELKTTPKKTPNMIRFTGKFLGGEMPFRRTRNRTSR